MMGILIEIGIMTLDDYVELTSNSHYDYNNLLTMFPEL